MTARSKFVFQTASPVREQSVQSVVLVTQNPLEQIIVHIFNEFGCCKDIGNGNGTVQGVGKTHAGVQSASHVTYRSCL